MCPVGSISVNAGDTKALAGNRDRPALETGSALSWNFLLSLPHRSLLSQPRLQMLAPSPSLLLSALTSSVFSLHRTA